MPWTGHMGCTCTCTLPNTPNAWDPFGTENVIHDKCSCFKVSDSESKIFTMSLFWTLGSWTRPNETWRVCLRDKVRVGESICARCDATSLQIGASFIAQYPTENDLINGVKNFTDHQNNQLFHHQWKKSKIPAHSFPIITVTVQQYSHNFITPYMSRNCITISLFYKSLICDPI